jgi:hypothetical protein
MTTNMIKLAACLAWAGVAVSSAAPANALIATTQVGDWASCSSGSYTMLAGQNHCNTEFWYVQTIKLASVACGSGGCSGQSSAQVTNITIPGRKEAYEEGRCDGGYIMYSLAPCGC